MWNIVSMGLGLTGIVLAIFFYFKSRSIRRIVYLKRSFSLLGKSTTSLDNFSASYQGKELSSLRASKIMLWNCGNTTISKTDIANSEKLSINLPNENRILESRVLSASNKSNEVTLNLDNENSSTIIEFEYLDPGQGLVVSILHTGYERQIDVKGIIKGGSIGVYEIPKWQERIGYTLLAISIPFIAIIPFNLFDANPLYLFPGFIFFQVMGMFLVLGRNIVMRKSTHKSLKKAFEEDFTPDEFKG